MERQARCSTANPPGTELLAALRVHCSMNQKFYDPDQPEAVELLMPTELALVPLVAAIFLLVAFWELPKFLDHPAVATHVTMAAR